MIPPAANVVVLQQLLVYCPWPSISDRWSLFNPFYNHNTKYTQRVATVCVSGVWLLLSTYTFPFSITGTLALRSVFGGRTLLREERTKVHYEDSSY